ncbi:hypothetical protein [Kineosporia succinea]|uniref:Uncharacterized protein n=1 Tax=Kineosporia succinea TaxID=84632 RepID=A0ABT9NW67_9ACTN|nr:hypothetical protein [Kineosporia succinea]MDP9824674.1 hypothetical protein [Kineosporia succinea]
MDSQRVAGRAPMPAQRAVETFAHASGGGFCTICGTVWPCSQAGKQPDAEKALATSSS